MPGSALTKRTPAGVPVDSRVPSVAFNLNAATTRKWRNAMSKVRVATGSAKLFCCGDSTTFGSPNGPASSYPAQLTGLLNSYHVPAVQGLAIPPSAIPAAGSPADARWVANTGWIRNNGQGMADGASWRAPSGISTTLTYTPGITCDSFDIYYLMINGSSGSIAAQGTGGSVVNFSAVGSGAGSIGKTTVTCPSGSSNVLTMTPSIGDVYIVGVEAYLSTQSAVRVANGGVSSSATGTWKNDTGWHSLPIIRKYQPDMSIIMLGINDAAVPVSVATWTANMQAIISACQASGDVMLMSVVPSFTTGYAPYEVQYQAAAQQLALINGCSLIDIYGRFGSWALANAAGWMYDDKHPQPQGYSDIAAAVLAALRTL